MGTLFVVATPIGNLGDITLRALEVLGSVDFIACEDTRRARTLIRYYNIKVPLVSCHQHSASQKINWILDQLKLGKNVALITDAGTPGISDAGGKLIKEALSAKIEVMAIPGPSAVIAALSVSGFIFKEFLFLCFFPKKK